MTTAASMKVLAKSVHLAEAVAHSKARAKGKDKQDIKHSLITALYQIGSIREPGYS